MTEIYLLRHGQTDANKNYIVQERMDNPINTIGMEQALLTGKYLKQSGINFDLVISSPLKRAFKTAELVNHGMVISKPILIDRNLIERNFGDYDGKKITDDYYELTRNGLIPNMETDEELESRAMEVLTNIAQKHENKRLLIVTHSHLIKAILVKLIKEFSYLDYLHNCSLTKLIYKDGEFQIIDYNINPVENI